MDWLSTIWDWFTGLDTGTKAGVVSAFIGGIAFIWGVYTHYSKRKSDSASHSRSVTASHGGVAAGRDIKARDIKVGDSSQKDPEEKKKR